MTSVHRDKAFTPNWLQSLTLVAKEPVAQGIKPLLDTINDLSRTTSEVDRMESAQRLWDYCVAEELRNLLSIIPIQQPAWLFDRDDPFVFQRTSRDTITDFETWTKCLGVQAGEVALTASVTSRDWLSLVRQEAVRLQRSMNAGAVPSGMNLNLPCTAAWDLKSWSIRFDLADWVVLKYEDGFTVERPEFEEIEEAIMWALASAHDRLIPKGIAVPTVDEEMAPWIGRVKQFTPLHRKIMMGEKAQYAPWFRKVWTCVWPVVYREQNVLGGQADIDFIRRELAECVKNVPRLTVWMFMFAKLVCNCQLGRGLGISGDYSV